MVIWKMTLGFSYNIAQDVCARLKLLADAYDDWDEEDSVSEYVDTLASKIGEGFVMTPQEIEDTFFHYANSVEHNKED